MKFNKTEREFIFFLIENQGQYKKSNFILNKFCEKAELDYDNTKGNDGTFKKMLNKFIADKTILDEDGYWRLGELYAIKNEELRLGVWTTLAQNKDAYLEILLPRKYTYIQWVQKQIEIAEQIKKQNSQNVIGDMTSKLLQAEKELKDSQ